MKTLNLELEPFVNIDNRPDRGSDIGSTVYLKSYLTAVASGLYLVTGTGGAHTSVKFPEQGTRMPLFCTVGSGTAKADFYRERVPSLLPWRAGKAE